jgi:hypothetical protein
MNTESSGGNNNTTIIIVVVVVLLLCCCCTILGVGLWFYGDTLMEQFSRAVPTVLRL